MKAQVRIVGGSMRGRKLICKVDPNLRPTPDRVREALFSLLGARLIDRPFYDVFAGTGIVGMEAISRGAESTTFLERDFRLLADLQRHVKEFRVEDQATFLRTDAYRWAERWEPPSGPVVIFISPPFRDFEHRPDSLFEMIAAFQEKVAEGSVVVLQGEHDMPMEGLPDPDNWKDRRYGRNHLLVWEREPEEAEEEAPE